MNGGTKSYQSSSLLTFSREKTLNTNQETTAIVFLIFLLTTNKTSSQATSRKNRVNVKTCLCRDTARMLNRLSGINVTYTSPMGRPSHVSSAHPLNSFCDLVKKIRLSRAWFIQLIFRHLSGDEVDESLSAGAFLSTNDQACLFRKLVDPETSQHWLKCKAGEQQNVCFVTIRNLSLGLC